MRFNMFQDAINDIRQYYLSLKNVFSLNLLAFIGYKFWLLYDINYKKSKITKHCFVCFHHI